MTRRAGRQGDGLSWPGRLRRFPQLRKQGAGEAKGAGRRHGTAVPYARPTVRGWAFLALTAAAWALSMALDDAVASSVAAGLTAMLATAALLAAGQRAALRHPDCRWLRPLLPAASYAPQWERVDADGTVLERGCDPADERRALLRCESCAASWRSPLGLLALRCRLPRRLEQAIVPQGRRSAQAAHGPRGRLPGQQPSPMVRQYAPDDPMRLIAWRHSARHGELMTRCVEEDGTHATVIVLDTANGEAALDASAAAAVRLLSGAAGWTGALSAAKTLGRLRSADHWTGTQRFIVCAGGHAADDPQGCLRLLAAATAQADSTAPDSTAPDSAAHAAQAQPDSVRTAAQTAAQAVARQTGPVSVVAFTVPGSPLAGALRGARLGAPLRIVAPATPASPSGGALSRTSRGLSAQTAGAPPSADAAARDAAIADGKTAANESGFLRMMLEGCVAQSSPALPRPSAQPARRRFRRAVACLCFALACVLAAPAVRALMHGGSWGWFAAPGIAVVCAANMPRLSARGDDVRALALTVAIAAAALWLIGASLRNANGHWPLPWTEIAVDAASPDGGAEAAALTQRLGWAGAAGEIWDAIRSGFGQLIAQWAPVSVASAQSDAAMDVVAAFALVLVAWLLALSGRCAAWLTLATGAAFELAALFGLYAAPAWHVACWAALGALALWATQEPHPHRSRIPGAGSPTRRGQRNRTRHESPNPGSVPQHAGTGGTGPGEGTGIPGPVPLHAVNGGTGAVAAAARRMSVPLAAAIATAALTLAGTPAALNAARRVDLSTAGTGTPGLLSSSSVDPLVDLRRTIASGSTQTALTYQANRPLYLRMATLSDFNGDVWSFERSLTDDAALFGSSAAPHGNDGADAADSAAGDASGDSSGSATAQTGTLKPDLSVNPMSLYARLFAGSERLPVSWWATVNFPFSQSDLGWVDRYWDSFDAMIVSATVTVGSLSSRFLPVAGIPLDVRTDGDGWATHTDGTVYNRDATTAAGMTYTSQGIYLEPVTSGAGFGDVEMLQDTYERLYAAGDTGDGTADFYWENLERSQAAIHDAYGTLDAALPASLQAVVDGAAASGVDVSGSDTDAQIAAMRYLVSFFTEAANGFSYALDVPDGNGRGNLAALGDFMERRSGYCTHYAAALAVLGRALGVPTRMVMGYMASGNGHEPGPYDVAANQLHAWTEAYIDGIGWVPFDVTPASGADSASPSAQATGDASASATPEDDANDSSSASEETQDSAAGSDAASSDAHGGEGGFAGWMAGHRWAAPALWLLGAGSLAAAVWAVACLRWRRWTRRRLACIDTAMAAGDGATQDELRTAWGAAWELLARKAARGTWRSSDPAAECGDGSPSDRPHRHHPHRRHHCRARWERTASDADIAEAIIRSGACPDVADDAIRMVARNAAAAAFGGTCEPLGGSATPPAANGSLGGHEGERGAERRDA